MLRVESESRRKDSLVVVAVSENIVETYPGEEANLSASVIKPERRRVHVTVKGLPSSIARVLVTPIEAEAPFVTHVKIKVLECAPPGVYFFELTFTRLDTGFSTTRPLVLVVLPKRKSQLAIDKQVMVKVGRELYETIGPSMTIYWYLLNLLFHGVKLVEFQKVYEFHRSIASVASKNAALKVLKRLEFYGLVDRVGRGVYRLLPVSLAVALNAIDKKRVRTREQVLRLKNGREIEESSDVRLPRAITRVFSRARELVKTGNLWMAVDLLAHTALPVRETGVLLAWMKDVFIYFENKDSKIHLLQSRRLADLFKQLCIPEGDMTRHKQYEAGDIIREMFGSHDNARRVHYLLKELGWFQPLAPGYYFYEIRYHPRPVLAIYVLAENGDKRLLYEASLSYIPPGMREEGPVVPTEHVKPENEDTYFHRTKGWSSRSR